MHYGQHARSRLFLHAHRLCNPARTLYPGTRHRGPFVPGVTSRRRPAQSESRIRAFQSAGARDALKPQGGIYRGTKGTRTLIRRSFLKSSLSSWGGLPPQPLFPKERPRASPGEEGRRWDFWATYRPPDCRRLVSLRTRQDSGSNCTIPLGHSFRRLSVLTLIKRLLRARRC